MVVLLGPLLLLLAAVLSTCAVAAGATAAFRG